MPDLGSSADKRPKVSKTICGVTKKTASVARCGLGIVFGKD
jgi:hypothetical protein